MIISDLNHIETVSEDNQIEGGNGYTSGYLSAWGSGLGVYASGYSGSSTSWYGTGSYVSADAGAYIGNVGVSGSTYASSGYYWWY